MPSFGINFAVPPKMWRGGKLYANVVLSEMIVSCILKQEHLIAFVSDKPNDAIKDYMREYLVQL